MRAIDECPPRGEVVQRPTEAAQQPRGSGPLPSTPARARGSSVRATPSLRPPRILGTISLFYRKEDRGKGRLRGRLQLFFLILVWGFPIVAAGILFDVDHMPPFSRAYTRLHTLGTVVFWSRPPHRLAALLPFQGGPPGDLQPLRSRKGPVDSSSRRQRDRSADPAVAQCPP